MRLIASFNLTISPAYSQKSLSDKTIGDLNAQIAKGVEETNALKKVLTHYVIHD